MQGEDADGELGQSVSVQYQSSNWADFGDGTVHSKILAGESIVTETKVDEKLKPFQTWIFHEQGGTNEK